MKSFSRRSVLYSAVSLPVIASCRLTEGSLADANLLKLGSQFDALADELMKRPVVIIAEFEERLDRIEAEIVATPATTIDGFRVKARAACWALLGDLGSGDQSTTDKRMALSIVRDLIRLYDPDVERPGALKDLVKDIEDGASLPPAA
jgi:hypothetical protein